MTDTTRQPPKHDIRCCCHHSPPPPPPPTGSVIGAPAAWAAWAARPRARLPPCACDREGGEQRQRELPP